jgi:xanthine dehydrogenase molybdenum-binding subunit
VFTGFGQAPRTNAPTFSAAFAEVAVNVETGEVCVERMTAVQDVGRAINPQIVEGQIQGAIHQGIGYALSEGLAVDVDSGTVLNGTFMDYRLLTSADSPPIDVVLVEEADGTGPYGAKGIAESGIVVAAPAIANAILHATGASVRDLPMTPERVLDALDAMADVGRDVAGGPGGDSFGGPGGDAQGAGG